jgi:hypothetical protein
MIATELKRLRNVGVPLVAIGTADQGHTIDQIRAELNGKSPLILWDVIRGYQGLNELGVAQVDKLLASISPEEPALAQQSLTNFTQALIEAIKFSERTCIIALNGHAFYTEAPAIQAILNLRDPFKGSKRTLVLIGPDFRLPSELSQDVLVIQEALPTADEIKAALSKIYDENGIKADVDMCAEALRGLSAFSVEQAGALAITPDQTVSIAELWERKRAMLPKGLAMEQPLNETIGGNEAWIEFSDALFSGPEKPNVIIFIDEVDKVLNSAMAGDTSGTSQDAAQELLTIIEDHHFPGSLFLGPPGGGKTFTARATAAKNKVPFLRADLGAAKGSLVGESERRIREITRAILAIAGDGRAYFVATCNKLDVLAPEMRRRLSSFGLWFFDMLNSEERAEVGILNARKYPTLNVEDTARFFAKQEGWSGANIRDCCRLAHALSMTLEKASRFVIPAATQDPQGLERLRATANGRFLSASKAGFYKAPRAGIPETAANTSTVRKIAQEKD